ATHADTDGGRAGRSSSAAEAVPAPGAHACGAGVLRDPDGPLGLQGRKEQLAPRAPSHGRRGRQVSLPASPARAAEARSRSGRQQPFPGSSTGTFAASSASQAAALPSDGARQSPRGLSDPPELIFGPFGTAERLNWLNAKNRFRNTSSHWRISARS